eukprot:CAMPEP_0179098970 /NCGR_PEP_ID=MMETSP0796-20121207/45636_1 /TAXON_ID=73915 /ORGANISM="Pyrodinium bahamense, Strain pbaha01" /LENGTH=419 /DNA_ID=CAMNT_0020796761 /DNA_START=1 /DNA_END=1257 /DNA_ORIENTATION=-
MTERKRQDAEGPEEQAADAGAQSRGGKASRTGGGPPGPPGPEQGAAPLPGDDDAAWEEVSHFLSVCYSIAGYAVSALHAVDTYGRDLLAALRDPNNQSLWCGDDPATTLREMKARVAYNQQFLDELVRDLACCPVGPPGGMGRRTPPPGILRVPRGYMLDPGNLSKTRSTLRQFVRDWAREGAAERESCYEPLLRALEQYMPLGSCKGRRPKVLTPGSGLGRLTFEAARRGYFAEGNEFSYHMLLGTAWVLNDSGAALGTTIFPFVVDTVGRRGAYDHLRPVMIPDVCPGDFCHPESGFGDISMRSGEFVEVYKNQAKEWDAVLTAFFLDTAHNVFIYIRVLANLLRPGGIWANLGPLLWHYSPTGGGPYDAVSIELSWEEVRVAVEAYFIIQEIHRQDATYTDGALGGRKKVYHCLHF